MLIADGGGSARVPVNVPNPVKQTPQPAAASAESDAAARARELQRQLEALLEKLREAQRQAEEARKRAIEAQRKAREAREHAEKMEAQAQKTKDLAEANKARKAQQEAKLEDARAKEASAQADLKDKDVTLLNAQIEQKREQKKSPEAKASAAGDKKVADAQGERDQAQKTNELSKLNLDAQEKESKAQDAEAKVVELTPPPGKPQSVITDKERTDLSDAQTAATKLRGEADAAHTKFADAVGTDAQTEFYGSSPPSQAVTQPFPTVQATPPMPTDPLHSPLLQLLQVQPRSGLDAIAGTTNNLPLTSLTLTAPNAPLHGPTTFPSTLNGPALGTGGNSSTAPLNGLFQPKPAAVTPEVSKTLSAIADGKTVDQIAKDRHIGVDKVIAEANAAGIRIESGKPGGDAQVTTVKKGDSSLSYTHDAKKDTLTVKGDIADPTAPGGRKTFEATEDGKGRYSRVSKDEKAGTTTTVTIDPQAGTRTESVVDKNGLRVDTTTSLTGAKITRPVGEREGYLEFAKAVGRTPEQLFTLNPTVDYGKPLEPGQELVVSDVTTTVKTYNKDGTTLERTVASDGSVQAVATSASGRRTVLEGKPDDRSGPGETARKAIFEDRKPLAEVARSMGLSEEQVLAALPEGTVEVTEPTSDNGDVQTRTMYDPVTDRVVVESHDWQHDHVSVQVIDEKSTYQVHDTDPKTKQPVTVEKSGGLAYLQKQAEDKADFAAGYGTQIANIDKNIRLYNRMGESTTDLRAERKALVEKQDAAKGEATVAGAQYTAALTKNQQVVLDKQAAIAYQNHSYARPGSQEKADAAAVLDIKLAALDNVDRLVDLANKDVTLAKAGLDKQIKDTAKANADADLQTQFQKWKDDVWMWQGIDKKTADKMKAEGQVPTMRMYPDMKQENDAAWEAFVSQQTDMDKYGDDYLTPEERPARNAWLARNRTSDDAVASDLRYNDALSASTRAGTHLTQGDLDRLQQKKDAWIKANPTLFSLNFQGPGEKENQATLDLLQKGVADGKIKDLQIGADRKYTQHLQDMSAADRADPEAMKEADEAYAKDNSDFNVQLKAKIKDLSGQALDDRAQAVDAYIKDWEERNPDLKRKLDALGTDQDQRSLRAAEYRSDQIRSLLSASEQGRQRLSAMDMNYAVKGEYMGVGDNDSAQISKDLEGINQGIEKHTFVRDAWGAMFGDSADEAKDYTEDRLAKSDQLRKDLAAGKISVSKYSTEEDALMDGYDVKSAELAQKVQDADGTWSVVDEAVRMTVTAAAGIAATIASGGNVAVGFGTAMLVSEVWDTTGDVVAAAQGRDIYADGHTSLWTLEGKALTGNASWEDVKFTLKDEAIDAASNIVTATGVGAGIKTSAAVSTRLLAKEAFVKSEGVLNLGGRALVGARAGITSQAVDGVGRVTVESGRVGLDGKWGTEEGNKRIGATFVSSAAGLVSAPLTGGASGAIPLWKVAPAAASSGTTNAAANATTNAAANATTNAAANATTNAAANATTNAAANATTNAAANATTNAAANATTNAAANATTNAAANATTNAAANATTNAAANATTNAAADATTNVAADAVTNVAASATLNAAANATTNAVANATTNAAANATANAAANATANAAANATANAAANATANAAANATANAAANATTNAAANATTNAAANATTNAAANATTNAAANATTDAATNATTSAASSAATSAAANTASSTTAGTQKMSYAGFSGQFVTDGAGSIGTGQLISYLNEGRGMNKGEFIAASLQALPGTLNNIALHPMMAARARAQAGNDAANRQPPPTAGRGTPDVKPVALEPVKIDAPVDALPGLAGRDATTLRVGGVKLDDLTNGLDVQTRASEATAPGGEVEFRVAIDTQKAVASAAEGVAASGAGNTRGRTAGTGKRSSESDNDGGVRRKGDDAQETKDVEAAQDAAIQVRMRAAGFDNVKIARKPGADGQAQPEIVVTGTKPLKAPLSGDTLLRPAYDGYDQRMSYLSGAEMVALYGSGTRPDPVAVAADRAAARSARTDMRLGVTARGRLNVGEYAPLASPTLQSVSTGIGTRSNLRAIATGVMDSIRWRSTVPIRDALGRELSVAVRPDEYRRTSMLQWGVSPMSRDTIFTVFAKDLINTAKTELFGKEGTPGYGVNVRSATDIGPAADGSGRVVELEISVKLDGEKVQLAEGEKDFFGGKASSSPDGHVKVPSSLMFDRVIEDFRIAPLLPIVKKLVGNPLPVTPSVERRSQMLLNDVIGAGDVVPTRFFEQFRKTFGDAKYRVQVVVPDRLPGFGRDPAATAVRNFLAKPDVAGFKALVEHGYVSADPDKALFFVPNRGGNHHRTSVPGKPLTEAFTDLTGKERRVPNKSTSNVWIIFADNGLERTLQRGIYGVKKVVYGALPAGLQRSAPSPHHLVGTGNLIDAMTGGRGRPNADSSRRLTAVAALPTLFDVGVLGTSVEFRVQLGLDAPSAAKSVRKGRMQDFKVSPDDTRTVDVPQWFPKLLERSLTGATPVVPKGGTAQLTTFLDKLQTHLGAEDGAALTALREKHMTGKDAAVGDGKFLRQPVAEDIVSLLVGLKPGAKPGSRPLLAGQPGESAPLAAPAAARTAGMRPADLNYLEGEATVNGRPVPARDIELAVPPDSILVLAERGNPPSAERIAADLRAAGHPEGKDVVLYLCEGATPARADAPVPASLARELSNRLGARVHAVDGDIVLGARTTVDGAPVVQRPNLPLTDVSQKAPHPVAADADFDAQQRFWLAPGGRTQEAQAPFSPKVLDQGAKVGDKSIDPLHLGIEDRVVDMRPMTAQNAREVFPLLVRQMGVSPEYNALGAEGMIDKWLGEIAAGTRYARVIYPAPGSTPVSDAPIGLISVHKEALLGESYRNTLPAALYRGSKPAGETSKEALQARGEVWQFSTYLGSNKNRYPGGVINKAARMQFMKDVMRQEAAKGAPVEAFYSRVSGGAPFITDSNGVTVLLKGHEFNVASSFSQESQTVGRGPIAVGYEDSSPFKSPDYPDGEPARHIYIYETDASLYGPEGKGTLKWRSKIEEAFDKVPGSRSLLSPMRTADKNYLVGEVMVNGRPMPAAEIELAVPPDSILVVAEHGNPPSAERIAADLRAAGHPEGKDVALYLFKGEPSVRPGTPTPEALARELGNLRGSRVHVVDGDVGLGPRNTARGTPVVQRPNLPLTDVSQNAPHPVTDADFDAQKRFWLAPGGRTQEAQAPFSQKVLDQGTAVGDRTIDLPRPGIEDRSVELVPFDAQHARDVLPHLTKELKYSPDFMQLKAEGMTRKWIDQINDGTRMAFVIYPASGSAAERRPLGIIAVHKEPLVGDNYIETLAPAHYAGEKPAGAASKEALLQRGEVWQFSTYLIGARTSTKSPDSSFPGGVVNSAAKKQVMDAAMAELARRGEPIDAFYARVHAGAPEAVPALGWPKTANANSLNSQARMADSGPVAVVHEKGPPLEDGTTPTRYVAIFETPVGLYAEDGGGTAAYRSLIEAQASKYPSEPWLAPKEWQGKPLVHRLADLNYLQGDAMVNGRPVPASLIQVAVPEKAFTVMAEAAQLPNLHQLAADMRAAGYTDGQEVALCFCFGLKTDDPSAPVPQSVASQLGDMLGARVHAVEGTITLGAKIELGEGRVGTAQPKLPLIDVSNGGMRPGENFDAQQRYWLAPNGRGERVDAPFGAEVRNMGARVGEGNWIDPMVLGIEERVVRLEQFGDRNAPAVLASLTRQLAVSPDFNSLGPEGMARKWQQEMADGTRMAYVVYPAEGSPLGQKPLGIIALHREALIDDKYVKTLPASYYRAGKFEAGEVSREDLLARGDVWQFSTYLNADAKQVPGTNKAGKMLTIEEAAAEGQRRGEEILAFYARVHGGGPLVLMAPHVEPNIPSLFGQESMARRGPIAVGLEQGSPVTGGADRYVLIFETDRGLYLPGGPGREKWTADIQKLIDDHPDPGSWLGAAQDTGASGPTVSRAAASADLPSRSAPAIDPDSIARESYDALARELGLTDAQADAMRGWTTAPRDAVTGFYDARLSGLKAETVTRTQAHVADSGDDAHYVSADIGNLGGLNAAMNNVAEAANVHFRGLAEILATQLDATGATVVPMRTGGDELGAVVAGIDGPTLAGAVEATQRQVAQYAQTHGLDHIPHPKHGDQRGVGLHIGYTSVSPDKTLDHIFTEADQGVDRSKQHVTTDEGRTTGVDGAEPGTAQATPAATATGNRPGTPAGEGGARGPARGASRADAAEVLTPDHPTRFATGSHEHATIDPDAVRKQDFAAAAHQAGLNTEQFTGLLHYGISPKDSVTGFYDARQSGVKADTVRRMQDLVANSDDNGFYVSADIANLGGLNHAMGNVAERANVHFKAMATLLADALSSTGATVVPLRTGGDELAAAVVGQIDEASLRGALDAAGRRIADYARAHGLADIPHPKRAGEKGVGMHMGYAETLPGRTLDRIFTEADMGVDASKNAAQHPTIDFEDAQPVAVRTSDGERLSVHRLMVTEPDGTRRPMTGAEVLRMTGPDLLGRGSSADVYPFGEGQVIKIYRNSREPDPDQSHLLVELPDGAEIHPRMATAASEVRAVRALQGAAGESAFVSVKGPFLVGDRLALVMPRHPFAGNRLELDLDTRTYSGEGSELLNERTARTAGALTERLNAVDRFPGDPQHLIEPDGSVIGFDPLEVSSGELARNYHEGEALKLARTGRQNAAQRPAPDRPDAGRVQFVAGPAPERVIEAGGLEVPGPGGVHATVAGAKWAAIEPMPAPFERDGTESAAYVYTTEGESVQVAADGSRTIPLASILAGRQVDAFGRFTADSTVRFRASSGGPGRQIPEGLIDLSKLGRKRDDPGSSKGAAST